MCVEALVEKIWGSHDLSVAYVHGEQVCDMVANGRYIDGGENIFFTDGKNTSICVPTSEIINIEETATDESYVVYLLHNAEIHITVMV